MNQQNSLDDEKNQLKLKIEDNMLIIKNKQAEIDKLREEKQKEYEDKQIAMDKVGQFQTELKIKQSQIEEFQKQIKKFQESD